MLVRDVMTSPVVTIHVGDGLDVAARLLREHRVRALPVVDDAGHRQLVVAVHLRRDDQGCRNGLLQERRRGASLVQQLIAAESATGGQDGGPGGTGRAGQDRRTAGILIGEVGADHLQRKVVLALQREDGAQSFDVI